MGRRVSEGICCLDMSGAAREMRTLSDLRRDNYAPVDPEGGAPPPPAGSWFDWWWLVLGGLLLVGLLALGALLASSILGAKTLHKLQNWPSPSPASTVAPSPSSAFTRPVTPTSAATRLPTISARPTPAPNCSCCVLCPTVNASACGCCQYCPSCDGQASAALGVTTLNMITRAEGGGNLPPDTVAVVGNDDDGGRIVAPVNRAVGIFNKQTHARISLTGGFFEGGRSGGDPWVTWDPISSRFFITALQIDTCAERLLVRSPPAIAGPKCAGFSLFGPQTYSVSGDVVVASPSDGCSPITNNVTGKIVLMQRNACFFAVMAKTAQNAGAIGVIIYRTTDTLVNMGGIDPTIVIPSVFIGITNGLALAANLPSNVTLVYPTSTAYNSTIFISVSNTSAPNNRNDFAHYAVSNGNYLGQFADYPKHSVDETALYITTQNFGNDTIPPTSQCLGPNVRAFNKAALMAGTGALTLWDTIVPGIGVSNPRFLFPAEQRTPLSDQLLPMLFFGTNTGNDHAFCGFPATQSTGIRIFAGGPAGLTSFVGNVPFPTPMTLRVCSPSDSNCTTLIPNARQPPPAVPYGIDTLTYSVMTGVVYDGKLYTALSHNITAVQTVVRWFEINVAPIAIGQQPTLLQWGDLNVSPDIDTFMPRIDVTDDGTMGISFYMSGPSQPVVAAYTFRLASDPPNTIRTPFHVAVPNNYTYFEDVGTGRNRYGDYIGLQVDPVDRQTFYGSVQRPNPLGVFNPPGTVGPCANLSNCVARDWTTDLFTFRVDADTCATDGIVTTPVVLPSTSVMAATNPGPIFTGDAEDFEMEPIYDSNNCVMGEEGDQECL